MNPMTFVTSVPIFQRPSLSRPFCPMDHSHSSLIFVGPYYYPMSKERVSHVHNFLLNTRGFLIILASRDDSSQTSELYFRFEKLKARLLTNQESIDDLALQKLDDMSEKSKGFSKDSDSNDVDRWLDEFESIAKSYLSPYDAAAAVQKELCLVQFTWDKQEKIRSIKQKLIGYTHDQSKYFTSELQPNILEHWKLRYGRAHLSLFGSFEVDGKSYNEKIRLTVDSRSVIIILPKNRKIKAKFTPNSDEKHSSFFEFDSSSDIFTSHNPFATIRLTVFTAADVDSPAFYRICFYDEIQNLEDLRITASFK
jgi:hypothetical protein